ncbi:hypothetical protein JEQ12_019041 [Ovis aries]|uniref:Uncharacterized protein n=1 Tax=Ovis aries TaxID=9940 RepID=A0A836AB09_SHEEP|nr:hypothetical protein JEQ12_019041 [Ovis aries]
MSSLRNSLSPFALDLLFLEVAFTPELLSRCLDCAWSGWRELRLSSWRPCRSGLQRLLGWSSGLCQGCPCASASSQLCDPLLGPYMEVRPSCRRPPGERPHSPPPPAPGISVSGRILWFSWHHPGCGVTGVIKALTSEAQSQLPAAPADMGISWLPSQSPTSEDRNVKNLTECSSRFKGSLPKYQQ